MKVWWLGSENAQGNFGDILTPHILDHFSINYEFVNHFTKADTISVGSIARRAGVGVTVLGSGIISRSDRVIAGADWKFVRGPYTRDRVKFFGGECPEIYGDPALLLPLMVEPSEKKHEVGIVPHNVDFAYATEKFTGSNIIGLKTRNYKNVVDKITQCESIISSSLHGVICAHAYGIPAAWVKSNTKLKGDDVKFEDFFASVDVDGIQSTFDKPVFINPKAANLEPLIKIYNEMI
jgi:pyruvyltransferase